MRDRNHYVVDEQSQLPPHLLPPPYLVDIDGNAHPAHYQEAILRLIRPTKQVKPDEAADEVDDYDEYLRCRLARVRQQSFGFDHARTSLSSRPPKTQANHDPSSEGTFSNTPNEDSTSGTGTSQQSSAPPLHLPLPSSNESCLSNASLASSLLPPQPSTPQQPPNITTEHSYATLEDKSFNIGEDANASAVSTTQLTSQTSQGSAYLSPVERKGRVLAVVLDSQRGEEGVGPSGLSNGSLPPTQNGRHAPASADSDSNTVSQPNPLSSPSPLLPPEEPIINVTDGNDDQNVPNMLSSLVYSLGLSDSEAKQAIFLWHNRVIIPPLEPAVFRFVPTRMS